MLRISTHSTSTKLFTLGTPCSPTSPPEMIKVPRYSVEMSPHLLRLHAKVHSTKVSDYTKYVIKAKEQTPLGPISTLPPHHLIHNPNIALNNLHHLIRHILIHIVRNRESSTRRLTSHHLHSRIDRLQQTDCVNT